MKLFHGSTSVVEKPCVALGRANLDFGRGFYLTNLEAQAVSWASRPLNASKRKFVNVYEFDLTNVLQSGYRCTRFPEYDGRWSDFVVSNRKGGEAWKDFDAIEGGIANDRVFNTIELYSSGLISKEEALPRLIYEKPNNQICILSQEVADRFLRFEKAYEIA